MSIHRLRFISSPHSPSSVITRALDGVPVQAVPEVVSRLALQLLVAPAGPLREHD